VIDLRKKDIFSIIMNQTRSTIITRLDEVDKTAYSDLLDSTEHICPLNSTGNFNYHLNFLLKNTVITKDGIVYKLTEKGKEISKFLKDINEKWEKLEKILRGEKLSILNIAEQFEEETGINMEKEVSDFQGIEIIMDKSKFLGIMTLDQEYEILDKYEQLDITDFQFVHLASKKKQRKKISVLSHPEIDYYMSPKIYGIVQEYLETNYRDVLIYVNKNTPAPFIISSTKFSQWDNNCSFVVAPSVFEEHATDKVESIKNK
jgi:hypothetical protein